MSSGHQIAASHAGHNCNWEDVDNELHEMKATLFPERKHFGQATYVRAYNTLLRRSPLKVLRAPGGALDARVAPTLGVDIIALALTAAAHGAPVLSSWIAEVSPQLELKIAGSASTVDSTAVTSTLEASVTAKLSASVAKRLGLSGNLGITARISIGGIYESVDAFVAVYLRRLTFLVERVLTKLSRIYSKVQEKRHGWSESLRSSRSTDDGYLLEAGELGADEEMPAYEDVEQDLSDYRWIRALEKRRRTTIKKVGVGGAAKASGLMGLFSASADLSASGYRFSRRRNDSEDHIHKGHRWHEYRHGYGVAVSGSFTVGPFSAEAALTRDVGNANPDSDGTCVFVTLRGSGDAVAGLAARAPEELSNITLSIGDSMWELLKGTLSATIGGISLPMASVGVSLSAATQVTLGFYMTGELKQGPAAFNLAYVRLGKQISAGLDVDGIPLYGGASVGINLGGGGTRVLKEWLGHSTIAYVQTRYMGMKARESYKPGEWQHWAQAHAGELERMRTSARVRQELIALAATLGQEGADILTGLLEASHYHRDPEQHWLHRLEQLFNLEAKRRRGSGDLSAGWKKYASAGDRLRQGKQSLGRIPAFWRS